MEKWDFARYLIDAKKSVDSIIYISLHIEEIKNINVKDKVESQLRLFYIYCRNLIDKVFPSKKQKKTIRETDPTIEDILYEADKTYAHKDADYIPKKYDTWEDRIKVLKEQLIHIREICKEFVPDVLTLDFVPHDKELYRLVNKINNEKEEEITKAKHPLYNTDMGVPFKKSFKVYDDTEDKIEGTPNDYAVIVEDGLNYYEGLQNRQDWCIKTNKLFGQNMWVTYNPLINPNYNG